MSVFGSFADDFAGELAAITKGHFDFIRIIDHVIVGQNVAVFRYYNTGAEPSLLGKMLFSSTTISRAELVAKKAAEEWLVQRRVEADVFSASS
jgi:hypothetical protein